MTIDEKILSILPKKKSIGMPWGIAANQAGYSYIKGCDETIKECATNIKQAFERGELCWTPSEKEISGLILMYLHFDDQGNEVCNTKQVAKAIITLLTKGKDNES